MLRTTGPRAWLAAGAMIAGFSVASLEAAADELRACGSRADILKNLSGEFDEQPVAIGLSEAGALIEVLASADGATWTLLLSLPSGVSCLVAAGQNWQVAPRVAKLGPKV